MSPKPLDRAHLAEVPLADQRPHGPAPAQAPRRRGHRLRRRCVARRAAWLVRHAVQPRHPQRHAAPGEVSDFRDRQDRGYSALELLDAGLLRRLDDSQLRSVSTLFAQISVDISVYLSRALLVCICTCQIQERQGAVILREMNSFGYSPTEDENSIQYNNNNNNIFELKSYSLEIFDK